MAANGQKIICVAGMHRSGTSMIARLLNLCGMDLGVEADMMPASDANPEGYWEHIWFNFYNNQILEHFCGAWDMLPVYPENWPDAPGIEWVKREASQVIARFNSPVWGWKDPRNSILMPFWKKMMPGLRTVVCLRNPLDVANSLNKRGSSSILFGLELWWQYNSLLLLETTESERVTTHFDVYFREGNSELHRLVNALGLQASEIAIESAGKTSKESLRHSVTGLDALEKASPWKGLIQTYCRLLVESGEHCRAMTEEWDKVEQYAAQWSPESCCMFRGGKDVQNELQTLRQQAADAAAKLEAITRKSNEAMSEWRQEIERSNAAIAQVCAQRDEILQRHDELQRENTVILNSKTWKVMTKVGAVLAKTGLIKPA